MALGVCAICGEPPSAHMSADPKCGMFIGPGPYDEMAKQQDAIYAAYLGICVLQTMCRKAGLTRGVAQSSELLKEMAEAFPFIPERVGREIVAR